jgi:hypothetical protein
MRGLEESLARIARRDELRERTNGGRVGAHRIEPPTPHVSPVVDEVTEALQQVVRRNPGVFATVVVQEADTAWSVWIGEWDGTLRTRVTRLESDPPAVGPVDDDRYTLDSVATPLVEPAVVEPAAVEPAAVEPAAVEPAAVEPAAVEPAAAPAHQVTPAIPVLPLPRRPVPAQQVATPLVPAQRIPDPPAGPAMNDRVAGRIADLLRREGQRESHGVA